MAEIGVKVVMELLTDSTSARSIIFKRGPGRMKHLDIKRLWLQDELRAKRLEIGRVPTDLNVSDLFTKPMTPARLKVLLELIGLSAQSNP
eukprot:15181558-Heterocapsa_arctica.AAC.1